MRIWKLLAFLWPSGRPTNGRTGGSRRTSTRADLGNMESLGDRGDHPPLWTQEPDQPHVAEVTVVTRHGQRQTATLERKYLRLAVAVVDYLLEHEWLALLGKYRREHSGTVRAQHEPQGRARRVPAAIEGDTVSESHITDSTDDSPWSIVAAIEQYPPSDPTSTTES